MHFVLEGSIKRFGALITIAAAVGDLIAAGFLLKAFQQAFLGQPPKDTSRWDKHPTYPAETFLASVVMLVNCWGGILFCTVDRINCYEYVKGLSALFPDLNTMTHGSAHFWCPLFSAHFPWLSLLIPNATWLVHSLRV